MNGSSVGEALALLALPFAASVVFVLMHAYLGVHVLRRRIVFADLALAQLSALGATVAFANGYPAASAAGFGYAFLFTGVGAALLTQTRALAPFASQEALIGILYVVATAATILVVDRSPQGAEHVKKMLNGSILTIEPMDLAKFVALYGAIGILHWLARRPLVFASTEAPSDHRRGASGWAWDFVFFLSFGIVVTSSVPTAGVLVVFSLLIVPAVIGSLFGVRFGMVLAIAWSVGIAACAAGLAGSYALDLPTGAAIVTAQGTALVLAGCARALVFAHPRRRRANLRFARYAVAAGMLVALLASSVWLMIAPTADQPVVALLERAPWMGATRFLSDTERATYEAATRDSERFQKEVDRLDAMEKAARHQGTALSGDEIRRIASYQQSFNEMTRGERFVLDVLRGKARMRERWVLGIPAALITFGALLVLLHAYRKRAALGPEPSRGSRSPEVPTS